MKDFEDIPEPLIEVPIDLNAVEKSLHISKESPLATDASTLACDKIKTEPLTVECMRNNEQVLMNNDNLTTDNDIKEEKPEYVEYNGGKAVETEEKCKITGVSLDKFSEGPNIDPTHEEQR